MQIGIVGLGLIGGSLGLDFRAQGKSVWGISRSAATCAEAIAIGAVDYASTNISDIPDLSQTAVIFVCTPIAQVLETIQNLTKWVQSPTIITDVASVKGALVSPAQALYARFIGSHPMAGKEVQGLKGAQQGLFQDRPCVVCPSDDLAGTEQVRSLWKSLGMRVYDCNPEIHDQAVAWISHLPVMLGAGLIHACQHEANPEILQTAQKLASSGFRDTTRVGGGNPELGTLMAQYNRSALLTSLQQFQTQIAQLHQLIEQNNWDQVETYLIQAQTWRSLYTGL